MTTDEDFYPDEEDEEQSEAAAQPMSTDATNGSVEDIDGNYFAEEEADELAGRARDMDVDVDVRDIHDADVKVIIGDVQYFWKQGIKISPTRQKDLEKISKVYVRPSSYEQALLILRQSRFVHLTGMDHTGKFAMAHALASELLPAPEATSRLNIRTLRCLEVASIVDLLEDRQCPKDSIFIMREAFQIPGLEPYELSRSLGALLQILDANKQYLILTSDWAAEGNNEIVLPEEYNVQINALTVDNLREVLSRHLAWHKVPEEWRSSLVNIALESFKLPYQVDLFATRVGQQTSCPERGEIEQLIKGITDTDLNARNWFSNLEVSSKYYTMLAQLCVGLSYDQLWNVFSEMVAALRRGGVRLDSPLNYGQDDLLDAVQAHITDAGTIEFDSPVYAGTALNQVKGNYRQQFRYLLPVFEKLVADNADNTPNARSQRIALAMAVGSFGQAELDWIKPTLRHWGQNELGTVRAAVGHACRQVCSQATHHQPVEELLRGWRSSSDVRLRWSAAAAYERLYGSLKTKQYVLSELEQMVVDREAFVRRSVTHAMAAIFRQDPDAILDTLIAWHGRGIPSVDRAIGGVIKQIADDQRRTQRYFRTSDKRSKALPLLGQMLESGSQLQCQAGMRLLGEWLDDQKGSDLVSRIEEEIIAAAERGGQQRRELLIDYIDRWIEDRDNHPSQYRSALAIRDQIQRLPATLSGAADIDLAPFFEEDAISDDEFQPILIDIHRPGQGSSDFQINSISV